MRGNSKAVPFHGILAVGSTKDEAVNRYRLLALGKGVSAFVDQGKNLAFVSNASSKLPEMFNPSTGELDLVKDESILQNLEFEAQAGEVEANHYVCESGCGLHLVYDSEALVKHCPSCTTAIASGEEGEATASAEDEVSMSADDEEEDEEDSEDEDSEDEDSEDDEDADDEEDSEDEDDEESDDDEEDEDDEDADDEEDDEDDEEEDDDSESPLVIAADSKEKAVAIYQSERQGIATAATTVEVEYKVCASAECGAHVLTEDESLSACPACDGELKEPQAETPATPIAPATPAVQASDDDESEDDEDEEEDDTDLEVIPDDEDSEDEDEDEEEEDDVSESNAKPTEQTAAPAAQAEGEGAAAPAPAAAVANAPEATLEQIEVNMLQRLEDTVDAAGLDVSFSSSIAGNAMWTAYIQGTPVAVATAADAGKNADIFADAAFGHAIIAGAKHVGVKNILNEMGFKGITHTVSVSSVVNEKVGAQVAEAKANLERDQKEYSERLLSAMATAAIGLNRGFFQGESNPVKAALYDALSSVGVKNAEVLIHNAFRTSSDDYHKVLFAKACEIIAKPLEVQESLAKAVLGTNYMGTSESSSATNTLEDRLAGMGTVTASAQVETTPAPKAEDKQESLSSDARISSVVAGLGRRR